MTEEKIHKEVKTLEKDLTKEIETRHPDKKKPKIDVTKTTDMLGTGLHYMVQIEQKFTHDFVFGWLPEKIHKYIKIIIPLFVMLIVLNLPIGSHLALEQAVAIRKALALFAFVALLWSLDSINMIVVALIIPVLGVILGIIKDTNPFTSFSNPVIYILMSGLIIATAFRKHELDRMLALRILAMSKGYIKKLLLYTMISTAILGMWMSNTATIALFIPVIVTLSSQIAEKTKKNYTSMLLLGAGFASAIGGLTTILGGNPNAITAAFLRNEMHFSFADWVRVGLPVSFVLFVTAYFILLQLYKVQKERIAISVLTKGIRRKKLNKDQRKLLTIFIPTIFFWLFGEAINHYIGLPIDFYRTEVIGLTAAILLFMFRVLDWDDVRRIPWEIFLLVGGGLTLGQILIDTGAATYIANYLFTVLSFLPPLIIILIIIFLAILLSNFVNNSSATIIMVPVVLTLAPSLGLDQRLMAMAVAMATAISPWTPVAMPAFSLLYGTGHITRKEMVRSGVTMAAVCGPILALLIYGLGFIY